MKGLFQASLAAAAMTVVAATPMAQPLRHRHLDHHHLNKRAVEIITVTQQVVEIEYVYSTVYVDPAVVQYQQTSRSHSPVAEVRSTTRSSPSPAPVPTTPSSSAAAPTTTPSTTAPSPTTTPSTTPSSVYVPPPPPPSSSESTTSVAAAKLPTEVIPVYVPPSSSSISTTPVSTTPAYTPLAFTPAPAPSSTTTPYVAPLPVTTPSVLAAAAPTSPASGDGSSGGSGDYSGEMYYGEGTYYDCGLGSCGNTNTNDDYVVAMSKLRMAPMDNGNPNTNPLCGQKVRVYSDKAPDGVDFTVQDKCPGCPNPNDLDICSGPFLDKMGTEAEGRIKIWWHFI
ncbi:hypothetical protein TWF696_004030 [Orbilia brochopaga]|uniref:Uncharacterized protein n=1 Tax=Orbilia brochopaga TaxID=3140254 RepID=A0AAV9V5M7_9PEZI